MATDKTFKYAGISQHDGEYKVRFANDIMRIKILAKNGHKDVRFFELDEPMTKLDAIHSIMDFEELQDGIAQMTIAEYITENAPRKSTGKKTVNTTSTVTTYTHVEQTVEDSNFEDVPF